MKTAKQFINPFFSIEREEKYNFYKLNIVCEVNILAEMLFWIRGGVSVSRTVWGSFCEEVEYPIAECGTRAENVSGIVLNAERKPTNSIMMQLFLFLNCVKTEWRAVDMASSVDRSVLNAIPVRSWAGSDVVFYVLEIFDSALINLFSLQKLKRTC